MDSTFSSVVLPLCGAAQLAHGHSRAHAMECTAMRPPVFQAHKDKLQALSVERAVPRADAETAAATAAFGASRVRRRMQGCGRARNGLYPSSFVSSPPIALLLACVHAG